MVGMNETNLIQQGQNLSTDVNASDVLYLRDKMKILKKIKGELIENNVLQWQFMSCKNINQYNNGLCKSSSDYKSAGV